MSIRLLITNDFVESAKKLRLQYRNLQISVFLMLHPIYFLPTLYTDTSLASRLLIILKSLNTNRIQVQAQLSHTRPILFDMPTLALSRTVRNVNIYSRPIYIEITAQKKKKKICDILFITYTPAYTPPDFSCGSSQGEEFLETQ